jgi:hypothetical protein
MIVANAGIPAEIESADSSLSNATIVELSTTRVVFFAGDDVSSSEKYEMPSVRGFGGIPMPHIKTLPKENKGMLYRCQLTPLRPAKITQPLSMLSPGARDSWESSFVQTNAIRNPDGTYSDKLVDGFSGSDQQASLEGQFKPKKSNHMGFKTRYPGHDIRQITKRSLPHGAGGVVEVTALKGATSDEIRQAQLFFFPDWNETRKGDENFALPATIRELEDHLKARTAEIKTLPTHLHNQYRQISGAMLQSCNEFRIAYLSTFQKNEIILKDSAAKGNTGASYPQRAEEAMQMLEYKRKDDLVSGESSSVDRLARIMEKKESGEVELRERELALREREIAIKEAELGLTKNTAPSAPVAQDSAPEPIVTDTVEERLCGAIKGNGESCKRVLKEFEVQCFQHQEAPTEVI